MDQTGVHLVPTHESNHNKVALEGAMRQLSIVERSNITLLARVSQLEKSIAETNTSSSMMQKQPATAVPAPKYTVEPISGDGYCMFGSIEKAMGWNRGDAKRRIIQFILSKTGPTNEDLVVTLADVVGVDKVDPNSIRNAYISQLVEDRYHGGEAEASLLSREQNGRLRIVLIRTSGLKHIEPIKRKV